VTSGQKKRHERAHFELFAGLFAEIPGGCHLRLSCHDDNPDFLVKSGDRTIGIEHTELFKQRERSAKRPYAPVELEGIQQGIIRKAKESYTRQGLPPVTVTVWFDPSMKRIRLVSGRSKAIGAELSQFVAEWVRVPHPADEWPRPGDRIPEISHLSIYEGHSSWTKGDPSLVGPPDVSELQRTIDGKDAKYAVYQQKCDECWLLIAANRFNPAQGYDFTLDNSPLKHCYKSRFERVFFLELGDRWLRELPHSAFKDTSEPIA
jgi:hypothetical protein